MSAKDNDLEIYAILYEKSKNPLYAWHAMRISIMDNLPIPRWAQDYFRDSATFLLTLSPGQGKRTQAAIVDALGLSQSGVSFFAQHNDEHRKITIALAVHEKRQNEPRSRMETTINEIVGASFGLKHGEVRKIYQEYSPWISRLLGGCRTFR